MIYIKGKKERRSLSLAHSDADAHHQKPHDRRSNSLICSGVITNTESAVRLFSQAGGEYKVMNVLAHN
jgi:hypothetical protein